MTSTIWIILAVASVILLALYWNRQNAVWGGLTIGVIVGFAVAIFGNGFNGFNWYTIGKIAIIGVMLGFGAELLGLLSDYLRKRT